jgi:choline-sulfatase
MKRQGILDKTLVILLSPHGENLGEHGLGGHQACLYEPIIHIPLIMRCPNVVPTGMRVQSLVQLTDILPTVLDLIDFNADNLRLQGISLSRMHSNRIQRDFAIAEWEGGVPALLEGMLREGDYKYIWASDGREELFNLADDPKELRNLASQEPERVSAMARRLKDLQGSYTHPTKLVPTHNDVEETILNDLRALGYRI